MAKEADVTRHSHTLKDSDESCFEALLSTELSRPNTVLVFEERLHMIFQGGVLILLEGLWIRRPPSG